MKEELSEIRASPAPAEDGGQNGERPGRFPIRERGRDVVASLRGRVGVIVKFALAFELLRFLLLAPLAAGVLRVALERWGRCSVGNFEVVAVLLSPPGPVALVAMGVVALTDFGGA